MAEQIDDNQERFIRDAVQQFIDAQIDDQEPDIDEFFLIVVNLLCHQTPSKALASATIARETSIFTAPVLLPNLSPIWL